MITQFKTRVAVGLFASAFLAAGIAGAQSDNKKAMMKPEMVVITGVIADLTCAAKGQVMMGTDNNATNDTHMTPDGPKESCATMCLKSGQPAGLYSDGKITATLLADASKNLYKFAAQEVELEGFWAGKEDNDVKTFVPAKIRAKGGKKWTEVKTGGMH